MGRPLTGGSQRCARNLRTPEQIRLELAIPKYPEAELDELKAQVRVFGSDRSGTYNSTPYMKLQPKSNNSTHEREVPVPEWLETTEAIGSAQRPYWDHIDQDFISIY